MLLRTFCLIILFYISFISCADKKNVFINVSDGKTYKTIKIGTQVWIAENLKSKTFSNGDLIPEAPSQEEWRFASENKKPAWCYYNNDPSNEEKIGILYNWYVVIDPRGLAPKGWHIPYTSEWDKLREFLSNGRVSNQDYSSITMKSKSGWGPYNGNDESGFNATPSGMRYVLEGFFYINDYVGWYSRDGIITEGISTPNVYLDYRFVNDGNGRSVRLIKD